MAIGTISGGGDGGGDEASKAALLDGCLTLIAFPFR